MVGSRGVELIYGRGDTGDVKHPGAHLHLGGHDQRQPLVGGAILLPCYHGEELSLSGWILFARGLTVEDAQQLDALNPRDPVQRLHGPHVGRVRARTGGDEGLEAEYDLLPVGAGHAY